MYLNVYIYAKSGSVYQAMRALSTFTFVWPEFCEYLDRFNSTAPALFPSLHSPNLFPSLHSPI